MLLATWNVNSLRVRLEQLKVWLSANPVDVIALQETKVHDETFPHEEIRALGLKSIVCGQKSYNGVALLSRTEASDITYGIPGWDDTQKRVLTATVEGVRIVDVYVPNGQSVGSEKYIYKLGWLGALKTHVRNELDKHARLIVLGDYNIAPEDQDVHDPKTWEGNVHVSAPERAELRELLGIGLCDLYRKFQQPVASFSWWDYRMGGFRRNHGLRIDLILGSSAIARQCVGCRIDKTPRSWERPSDHAPVIAEFDFR